MATAHEMRRYHAAEAFDYTDKPHRNLEIVHMAAERHVREIREMLAALDAGRMFQTKTGRIDDNAWTAHLRECKPKSTRSYRATTDAGRAAQQSGLFKRKEHV